MVPTFGQWYASRPSLSVASITTTAIVIATKMLSVFASGVQRTSRSSVHDRGHAPAQSFPCRILRRPRHVNRRLQSLDLKTFFLLEPESGRAPRIDTKTRYTSQDSYGGFVNQVTKFFSRNTLCIIQGISYNTRLGYASFSKHWKMGSHVE